MNRSEAIRTAAGAVRAPFAIADVQIVRFRGERSRARLVPQTAMGLIDTITERVAPLDKRAYSKGTTPTPVRTETAHEPAAAAPTAPSAPTAAAPDPEPPLADEQREEQLVAERKTRERKATRSNKSVASMAQDLAVAEAVADAHEQRARDEELDAKDFGPPSSS